MQFFEENREALRAYARMSQSAGARVDYVQGGGGNTSAKLKGGLMAIKASGFRLADVKEDAGYAVLDYEALRRFYGAHEPGDFADVEKSGSDEAKAAARAVEGLPQLRPSVEAGFHSVLQNYVLHTHSVYANLVTCAEEGRALAAKALFGAPYSWGYVPYTDPGARLTFSIRDEAARVEAETGKAPSVLFMENHGVIAADADALACERIHQDANDRIARAFGIAGDSFPTPAVRPAGDGLFETATPYLTQRLLGCGYPEKFFIEQPLYPDQLVFLVGTFAFGAGDPAADCCLCDTEKGVVRYRMPEAKALVIEQTLTAVLFIDEHIKKRGCTLLTMGEQARAFIAGWESEKYRKSLAGKKE